MYHSLFPAPNSWDMGLGPKHVLLDAAHHRQVGVNHRVCSGDIQCMVSLAIIPVLWSQFCQASFHSFPSLVLQLSSHFRELANAALLCLFKVGVFPINTDNTLLVTIREGWWGDE